MKTTQNMKILSYMEQFGSITPVDAMREFSCMRLASRISDLKGMGYEIERTMEVSKNKFGDPVHYARYTLC